MLLSMVRCSLFLSDTEGEIRAGVDAAETIDSESANEESRVQDQPSISRYLHAAQFFEREMNLMIRADHDAVSNSQHNSGNLLAIEINRIRAFKVKNSRQSRISDFFTEH